MASDIEVKLNYAPSDEATFHIIDNLWQHNEQYAPVNMKPLLISAERDGQTVAGLVARTWWEVLDIQYLWVDESLRGKGLGKQIMLLAEIEGKKQHCRLATVDTFSCQAPGFYQKLGYREYGALSGYAGRYTRHYMNKNI
ncbi:GNAT family N-acetyltransferase [Pantoea sp.]|uniref:GNAT family N-acetyltransferase n=1 Tax=Pantoea sp. TaxID=69393 RepID=UPI0028975572|nr:GNAT family N-acetyltransferase [Pantoea sp.]